jgi:hypothetical protein
MPMMFRFSVDNVNASKRAMKVKLDIPESDFERAKQLIDMTEQVLVAMVYTEKEFLALPEAQPD